MVRVKHVAGPGRFAHTSLSGASTHGDEHEVSAEAADYLCDELGYFERTGEITLSEDSYEVVEAEDETDGGPDYTHIPPNPNDMTKDELYEVASDFDIEGRSSMTKDELIDALSED